MRDLRASRGELEYGSSDQHLASGVSARGYTAIYALGKRHGLACHLEICHCKLFTLANALQQHNRDHYASLWYPDRIEEGGLLRLHQPKNDPRLSPEFRAGVAAARAALPKTIVGFTDFQPLYNRFVAFSIESKKPSEDIEEAQLRLGMWDMAHWTLLRQLEALPGLDRITTDSATRGDDAVLGDGTATSIHAQQSIATKLPAFLPGIFINGYSWYLVFTTMEGDQTCCGARLRLAPRRTQRACTR